MAHLLLVVIYMAFISLGLPDSLLGSAWPSMYSEFGVPVSFAGIVSVIISIGTVISSLLSDRMTKRFGTGRLTAISVGMTAFALFGFFVSHSFWLLCIWAVPYGLGAGSVDAALNNYVALHYESRHMSWLHCMWGVGTVIGPTIMGYVLTMGGSWNTGYLCISVIQIVLTGILIISLPLWKRKGTMSTDENSAKDKPIPIRRVVGIKGAKDVMLAFFCYCGAESTMMLWASSYMVLYNGISTDTAATLAGVFFIGITVGRMISGFLTIKFSDTQMIRTGQLLLIIGSLMLFLPFGIGITIVGVIIIGLGCAPIYPCIIHSTPVHFGEENSQAMIGVQMASAYLGTSLMPPLFGLIANHINVALLPVYLLIIGAIMIISHERLVR